MNHNLAFASAQQIWKTHYGYDFNGKVRRHALSGELKYDFTPSETQKYSVSLAHLERIGDNTERFNSLAAIVQKPHERRVDEPKIQPPPSQATPC